MPVAAAPAVTPGAAAPAHPEPETAPWPRSASPPAYPLTPGLPADDVTGPPYGAGYVGEVPAPAPPGALPRQSFWSRCWRHLQECFLGYPEEFKPAPLGQSVQRAYTTHVANGTAARMVLYEYDFICGTAVLNQRGKDQLARMASWLPDNVFPIVIERTPWDPALAEARRLAVWSALADSPFPVPPERVVIGPPLAYGLQGVEADLVYRNLLRQTLSQGTQGGLGGGSIGGTGGQGSGAPGRTTAPLGSIP
jgi:hypothetical protein